MYQDGIITIFEIPTGFFMELKDWSYSVCWRAKGQEQTGQFEEQGGEELPMSYHDFIKL